MEGLHLGRVCPAQFILEPNLLISWCMAMSPVPVRPVEAHPGPTALINGDGKLREGGLGVKKGK